MSIRSHLLLLALGIMLPLLFFGAALIAILFDHEREEREQTATDRTRALVTAVDAALDGTATTLAALAAERSLEAGDLERFRDAAARVLATQPGWRNVLLSDASGQQLVNLNAPQGSPLPRITDTATHAAALASERAVVGNLLVGQVSKRRGVAVSVGVRQAGKPAYVLTAFIAPDRFHEILGAQKLPAAWVIAVAGRDGKFIARIPRVVPGSPAAPAFAAAIAGGVAEGSFRGTTLEGVDTYQYYSRSHVTGWVVGLAIPVSEIHAPALRLAGIAAAWALATALIAFAIAGFFSRRISRPITQLASAARTVGTGAPFAPEKVDGVNEVAEVARALKEAVWMIRQREETQRRAEDALRAANRSKDEFLATLSHELRNPLSAIMAASHLLGHAKLRPELIDHSREVIDRQAGQMNRLVDDLLNISGITLGKIALERQPIDLAALATRAVDALRHAGRLEGYRLDLNLSPAWIEGDPARIEQIVANLLHNSLKFTRSGGEIRLRVGRSGGEAVLEVEDNGRGIDPKLVGSIFDLFVQGEQSIDRPQGGLGIGLALVKRLTELHGGTVEAHSAGPGTGSTFTVRFPAIEPPADAGETSQPPGAALAGRRILIVEDNQDAREMMAAVLEHEGHQVVSAADGAAALAQAERIAPEVAIVDIGLPGMSGYEIGERLRGLLGSRALLVAVTGYGQPEDRERGREVGFDAYLVKPVDPERLQHLIVQSANDARSDTNKAPVRGR